MYKNSNLRKEVGIAIKSKETSSQFESVRNSYVAIMLSRLVIVTDGKGANSSDTVTRARTIVLLLNITYTL